MSEGRIRYDPRMPDDPWDVEEQRLLREWRRLRPDQVLVLEVARRGRGPRMAALREAVDKARRGVT